LSNDLRKLFAFDLTKFKLSVEGARIGGAIWKGFIDLLSEFLLLKDILSDRLREASENELSFCLVDLLTEFLEFKLLFLKINLWDLFVNTKL
jgi:hypothetical protein